MTDRGSKEHIEQCLKVHTSSSSLTSITQDVNFMLISLFVHAELVKFNFDWRLHGVMAAIPKRKCQKEEDIQTIELFRPSQSHRCVTTLLYIIIDQ